MGVALDSPVPSQAQEGHQPGGFIEATCPTQRQGTKGRRRSLLHGAVGHKQQKPEIRQKQRDNAIKAAKEKKKAADASKAAARKAMPKVASKAQAKMPKAPKMKGSGGKR